MENEKYYEVVWVDTLGDSGVSDVCYSYEEALESVAELARKDSEDFVLVEVEIIEYPKTEAENGNFDNGVVIHREIIRRLK